MPNSVAIAGYMTNVSIKVYFETATYAEYIKEFATEELYMIALPTLEKWASENGGFITESMDFDN